MSRPTWCRRGWRGGVDGAGGVLHGASEVGEFIREAGPDHSSPAEVLTAGLAILAGFYLGSCLEFLEAGGICPVTFALCKLGGGGEVAKCHVFY